MGTIVTRKRADGKPSYLCQIAKKLGGKTVREARTFHDHKAAKAWIRQREAELDNPHAFKAATQTTHTLGDAISRYIAEYGGEVGKTKAQCLTTIRRHSIASMACADIGSADIVALARALGVGAGASTVGNYLAHLSAVFVVAKRAWSYPLDPEAMADALFVLRKQRLVTKSNKRDRRPTLDELDRLLGHFDEVKVRAPRSAPMVASSSSRCSRRAARKR